MVKVSAQYGFLLIDSCLSIVIVSLMIIVYLQWQTQVITSYNHSRYKIEGLFNARSALEKAMSGEKGAKAIAEGAHRIQVKEKHEGDFCWITVEVVSGKDRSFYKWQEKHHRQNSSNCIISLTSGYSTKRNSGRGPSW